VDILKSIVIWLIGLAFILLFFPVTLVIWILFLPFDRERRIVHWLLVYQALMISLIIPIWRVRIEGREKAVPGTTYVIISNHQSILDILFLNCLRYRFKWISKKEVYNYPLLGQYLKMADYITVDRSDAESKRIMLLDSYNSLVNGVSIMIFPEGTRTPDGEIKFFKRGAFQLAISAKKPILPVIIDGSGSVLPKHGLVFKGFHKILIRVLDPVSPENFGTEECEKLAMKFQEMMAAELKRFRTNG
jgi:1-acyl-sn-glycerol-3-phosphate acyltransferase